VINAWLIRALIVNWRVRNLSPLSGVLDVTFQEELMKSKAITIPFVLVVVLVGLSNLGGWSSSGQQFPEGTRKVACGCYCGGTTPGYFVFREGNCAGILAADACGEHFSNLPDVNKKEICAFLKAKGKPAASCPMGKEIADYCAKSPPDEKCEKPAPWFDTSSSSGCNLQDTLITIDQQTATATVSMCGYTVLKHVSENFGANVDKIFGAAYTSAFKQEIPKKVCCDKFREAARTGSPCDPRTDLDCDGKPNQTDVATSSFPVIDIFTRAANAPIDPFPFNFNLFDPEFSPNAAARGSKGVGDCACKWELIKGELKCNGVVDANGNKQHVYTATWRCPSTKAEVFTTKYAPSTAPCP
jgi:hypothetical protein